MNISRSRILFIFPAMVFVLAHLSGCATHAKSLPQHYTCIPDILFRCEPDERTCMTIPIEHTLGSVQIDVNLVENRVKSYSEEKILSEHEIFSAEKDHDLIYLNGRGRGIDNTLRSWNAVINSINGQLYFSSITTGAGHVIYGKCYENKQY